MGPIQLGSALGVAALVPTMSALVASPSLAASFSQIYSFGDSLVDTGNAFALTQTELGMGVPPVPYFEGRFSNGLLVHEYLAEDLGIPQVSLGFGGALSSEAGFLLFNGEQLLPVPGLLAQISNFLSTPSITADPDALYVLWAGSIDYLFAGVTDPSGPVNNITTAITTLNAAGAKNFLVGNLPDLGNLPLPSLLGASEEDIANLNLISGIHNQALAAALDNLDQINDLQIDLLDANTLFKSALAGELGFTNVTTPCTFVAACVSDEAVQDTFLFWDEVHPTTAAYKIVADAAFEQLEHEPVASVPEPNAVTALSLLGLVGLGATGANRRQRRRVRALK